MRCAEGNYSKQGSLMNDFYIDGFINSIKKLVEEHPCETKLVIIGNSPDYPSIFEDLKRHAADVGITLSSFERYAGEKSEVVCLSANQFSYVVSLSLFTANHDFSWIFDSVKLSMDKDLFFDGRSESFNIPVKKGIARDEQNVTASLTKALHHYTSKIHSADKKLTHEGFYSFVLDNGILDDSDYSFGLIYRIFSAYEYVLNGIEPGEDFGYHEGKLVWANAEGKFDTNVVQDEIIHTVAATLFGASISQKNGDSFDLKVDPASVARLFDFSYIQGEDATSSPSSEMEHITADSMSVQNHILNEKISSFRNESGRIILLVSTKDYLGGLKQASGNILVLSHERFLFTKIQAEDFIVNMEMPASESLWSMVVKKINSTVSVSTNLLCKLDNRVVRKETMSLKWAKITFKVSSGASSPFGLILGFWQEYWDTLCNQHNTKAQMLNDFKLRTLLSGFHIARSDELTNDDKSNSLKLNKTNVDGNGIWKQFAAKALRIEEEKEASRILQPIISLADSVSRDNYDIELLQWSKLGV
jgi:hypothetical protein